MLRRLHLYRCTLRRFHHAFLSLGPSSTVTSALIFNRSLFFPTLNHRAVCTRSGIIQTRDVLSRTFTKAAEFSLLLGLDRIFPDTLPQRSPSHVTIESLSRAQHASHKPGERKIIQKIRFLQRKHLSRSLILYSRDWKANIKKKYLKIYLHAPKHNQSNFFAKMLDL